MENKEARKEEYNKSLAVIVMAAGKGKRMKSELPKVMHRICGRPMIELVLDEVRALNAGKVVLIVGNGAQIVSAAAGPDISCAQQKEQKGTGHAVMVGLDSIPDEFNEVLVIPGDSPFVQRSTLQKLAEARRKDGARAAVFTCISENPAGYGRIVRGPSGEIQGIVEETDATDNEKNINEINASTYIFDRGALDEAIRELSTGNAQGEYYLTDVIGKIAAGGGGIASVVGDPIESFGINNRVQLAEANEIERERINNRLMLSGVTIFDPKNTYIDLGVEIGKDTVIYPMTFITGGARIGEKCNIGPSTKINNSTIGDECTVEYSWLDGCEVAEGSMVGPYAKIRPGCRLGPGSKAGTFIEMKEAQIGKGSKVPHLSYIGDAVVGEEVNIGAGTITCNYDGERKSKTVIGDRAFLGSDTMLVAPVEVGDGAVTAAGSTITRDVPEGNLGIERSEQRNVSGWRNRKKKKRGG